MYSSGRGRESGKKFWIVDRSGLLFALPVRLAFLTHEPFFPPSGGGSAEAIYLVEELVRRGHKVHVFCPQIADAESVAKQFNIHLHQFTAWQMGRYASLRNLKYLAYPFFLQRMV